MRQGDWGTALAEYLEWCKDKPFVWGKHDCCLFAANAVVAMGGQDYAAEFRGKYTTAIGSARALKKYGQGDIASTLTAKLGQPCARLQARRGDFALLENDGNPALGIVFNGVWYVGLNGLIKLPLNAASTFWSVD